MEPFACEMTLDGGRFWTDYVSGMGYARFWWLPRFCGSPDVSHLDSSADAVEFHASLSDYRGALPSFTWTATDGLEISEPNSQTTEVTSDGTVSWNTAYMAVTASFGEDRDLTSYIYLSYGTNDTPQAEVSVSVPRVMFANDDDGDSTNDYERVDFGIGENDVSEGSVAFSSDVGIENEIDPNPLFCDGDFFGPANILPEGANTNAYCTVSVVAPGPDALVVFEGDGPSNYPDPRFVARHGVTNEVFILIGKTYTVSTKTECYNEA